MQLRKAEIQNFRGIRQMEIEFTPGFTLITGENGSGKTSVLEALRAGLGGFTAGFPEIKAGGLSADEIRRAYSLREDRSVKEEVCLPLTVKLDAEICGENLFWTRRLDSMDPAEVSVQTEEIIRKAEEMASDSRTELPVLLFAGAAGRYPAEGKQRGSTGGKNSRLTGYVNALDGIYGSDSIFSCRRTERQVSGQTEKDFGKSSMEIMDTASRFMRRLTGSEKSRVFRDHCTETVMFRDETGVHQADALGSGLGFMLCLVSDLAWRMAVLNPEKKEKTAETSGVVLIDDLGAHLHPKMQWNVIGAFKETFPNVQFIAATNEAIPAVSAPDVRIVKIHDGEVSYSYSHYGLDVGNALPLYMDTDPVSPAVQRRIEKFYERLDADQPEEAERILSLLQEETAPEHPILAQMQISLDLERMDLED